MSNSYDLILQVQVLFPSASYTVRKKFQAESLAEGRDLYVRDQGNKKQRTGK